MRNFTRYPSTYVKASTSQKDLEQIILDAVNGIGPHNPSRFRVKTFTNLVYYMAGYAPDATLEDFIKAYKNLKNRELIDLPWD